MQNVKNKRLSEEKSGASVTNQGEPNSGGKKERNLKSPLKVSKVKECG